MSEICLTRQSEELIKQRLESPEGQRLLQELATIYARAAIDAELDREQLLQHDDATEHNK